MGFQKKCLDFVSCIQFCCRDFLNCSGRVKRTMHISVLRMASHVSVRFCAAHRGDKETLPILELYTIRGVVCLWCSCIGKKLRKNDKPLQFLSLLPHTIRRRPFICPMSVHRHPIMQRIGFPSRWYAPFIEIKQTMHTRRGFVSHGRVDIERYSRDLLAGRHNNAVD